MRMDLFCLCVIAKTYMNMRFVCFGAFMGESERKAHETFFLC